MKNILIALDYNPSAQTIAENGYALASTLNAQVTLLHVLADYTYYSSLNYSPIMGFNSFINSDFTQMEGSEALASAAEDFLIKTRSHLGNENIKVLTRDGSTAEQILTTAKEINADIIVLGKYNKSAIEKVMLGSITEHLLNKSTIPLFIIPTVDEEVK